MALTQQEREALVQTFAFASAVCAARPYEVFEKDRPGLGLRAHLRDLRAILLHPLPCF